MLDVRTAQTTLENLLHDAILFAFKARLPGVVDAPALRAVTTMGASGLMAEDDDLICVTGGPSLLSYRFSRESTAADDGVNVVQPTDVGTGPGRWLLWTTPLRIAPVVGGNSYYLHELAGGMYQPVRRVIVTDQSLSVEEVTNLLLGAVPAVWIEATDDDPEDTTETAGHRYTDSFRFTVYVIVENLRDQRQAAQGSTVDGEIGGNSLDGLIWSLLGGVQLHQVESGILEVKPGAGKNWSSQLAQRRVVRQRTYTILANVVNPPAANDTAAAAELDAQPNMAQTDPAGDPVDVNNYLISGANVFPGLGLFKPVQPGSAIIGGVAVSYAGESRTFTASRDTYRDLLPNGTMAYVEVDVGAPAPAVTATALRIGVTRTDGSSVIADAYLCELKTPYGGALVIPLT